MKKAALFVLLLVLPGILAAEEIVEKIEIVGNERVTPETVIYYLSVREGDTYNPDQFRRDFRVLWSTGFFSDIKFEESQGTRGRILQITVQENPVVRTITYKDGEEGQRGRHRQQAEREGPGTTYGWLPAVAHGENRAAVDVDNCIGSHDVLVIHAQDPPSERPAR